MGKKSLEIMSTNLRNMKMFMAWRRREKGSALTAQSTAKKKFNACAPSSRRRAAKSAIWRVSHIEPKCAPCARAKTNAAARRTKNNASTNEVSYEPRKKRSGWKRDIPSYPDHAERAKIRRNVP